MEGDMKDENLPPGFRFHPTDEELITYYLMNKISDATFAAKAVADVDLNKSEPWELPGKAKMGEKEWYFFSLRDRKYPTGVRTNRATNSGYWKTTGKDKEIFSSVTSSEVVGMKKTLVFYRGRAPRGEKTNWVMHEYRIHLKSALRTAKDEWVVCRVFQKSVGGKKYPSSQSRTTINNPYHHDLAPNFVQQQMMQAVDQTSTLQFPMGRNYMSNAEMAELTRALRGSSTSNMNLPHAPPPMQPQMNYPMGGCFTISGLNLNLRGTSSVPQQALRPPMQPLPPPMNQQDVTSSMFSTAASIAADTAVGYGAAEMNNGNVPYNRVMTNMDNCMDLDNYWPGY